MRAATHNGEKKDEKDAHEVESFFRSEWLAC